MRISHLSSLCILSAAIILVSVRPALTAAVGDLDGPGSVSFLQPAACGTPVEIGPNGPDISGSLAAGDCVLPTGFKYDAYTFSVGTLNDFVSFVVSSTDFPPAFTVHEGSSPFGPVVLQSFPMVNGASGSHGNLEGTYTLVITARRASGAGNYSLSYHRVIGEYFSQPLFDFDADNRTDISVYRPSNSTWYTRQTSGGFSAMQFGQPGDQIVPADYDGDRRTDIAVFRPATGTWFIVQSTTQTIRAVNWGENGDIPIPNSPGQLSDLVVYRPSNSTWYTRTADDRMSSFQWGTPGDIPVKDNVNRRSPYALFRPSEGKWYFRGGFLNEDSVNWGEAGDVPFTGDFDGDFQTDIGVYRPSTGQWFLRRTRFRDIGVIQWGASGDIPVPDDYDADGFTDFAVFRPSDGTWNVLSFSYFYSHIGTPFVYSFGQAGDVPVQSAYLR